MLATIGADLANQVHSAPALASRKMDLEPYCPKFKEFVYKTPPTRRVFFCDGQNGGVEADTKSTRVYQNLLTVDTGCDILVVSDRFPLTSSTSSRCRSWSRRSGGIKCSLSVAEGLPGLRLFLWARPDSLWAQSQPICGQKTEEEV
jgi:hypothetical protein